MVGDVRILAGASNLVSMSGIVSDGRILVGASNHGSVRW